MDDALRQEWERYHFSLLKHEAHHVQMAIDSASALQRELRRRAHQPGFGYIEANRFATRELTRLRNKDKEYDRRTDHGKKEGVLLLR